LLLPDWFCYIYLQGALEVIDEACFIYIWGWSRIKSKNDVFWDVTSCGSCKKDVSEELSASTFRVTRIDVLGSYTETSILVTRMIGALRSTETSVLNKSHIT
jgi:hypothetical protein